MDRLERLLLAFSDAGHPLTIRAAMDRLSQPMGRNDAESAVLRLTGAGDLAPVAGRHPHQYTVTPTGRLRSLELTGQGQGY